MAHLDDIPPRTRASIKNLACPRFDETPGVSGIAVNQRRVAVLSTAGLHLRKDARFGLASSDFRVIPGDADLSDILMSHVSINYDRTGFVQDLNTVLPLTRLAEMAAGGEIGSVANQHYAFMGATDPMEMQAEAAQVAGMLKADNVDAVLLVPV